MAAILAADDDVSTRKLYDVVLTGHRSKHNVQVVADGDQVLAALEEMAPDLILLDVHMPHDGITLCHELRLRMDTAQTPVIMVSASYDEETIRDALSAGADDYLIKPIKPQELIAKLDAVLTRQQARYQRQPALAIGSVLAHQYEVDDFLGYGPMGTTYRASYGDAERSVFAIKVLDGLPGWGKSPEGVQRYLDQASRYLAVTLENFANVVEADVKDGQLIQVRFYEKGISLADLADRMPKLEWTTVRDLAWYLADLLLHFHRAGFIHRNLRPSNVILTPDHSLTLLDFGIDFSLAPGESVQPMFVPAMPYYAPEQLVGREPCTAAADVYAMGATLVFLLTGEPPARGSSALEVMYRRLSWQPGRLLTARPDCNPAFISLVDSMLSPVPSHRPTPEDIQLAISATS